MKKPVSMREAYPAPVLRVAFRNFIEPPVITPAQVADSTEQQSITTKRLKAAVPQLPYYYQHHIQPKRHDFL